MIRSLNDGDVKLSPSYQSILQLHVRLLEAEIPHEILRIMDGWKLAYPDQDSCIFDVVEHCGSYGHEADLMEAYGYGIDDVAGYVHIDEAFKMFEKVHEERGNENKR